MLTDVLIIVLIIVCTIVTNTFLGSLVRLNYTKQVEIEKQIWQMNAVLIKLVSEQQKSSDKNQVIPKQPEPNITDNSDLYKDPVTGLLSMKAYRMNVAKLRNGGDLSIEDINKGD
jgi:hypothetical protein